MTVVIDFNFFLHIAQILIGIVTIFYGRRLYWLWIGFEAFLLGERLASFALYRSTDLLRFSAAALIGLLFALLALRFRRHVLALGGFLSAGVLGLIVTGRFLPIVPGVGGPGRAGDRRQSGRAVRLAQSRPGHDHPLGGVRHAGRHDHRAAIHRLQPDPGAARLRDPGRPGHLVPGAPVAAERVACDDEEEPPFAAIPPDPASGRMHRPAPRRHSAGPGARRGCQPWRRKCAPS